MRRKRVAAVIRDYEVAQDSAVPGSQALEQA